VQTPVVELAYATARPLDAVAPSETGPASIRVSDGCGNVIDCALGAPVTWKDRVTSTAAAYVTSPACEATIVQVPTATSVTLEPETVQTDVVELAKLTGRPLEALALSYTGPWSTRMSDGCANVIDCAPGAAVTANER
jgi:hypothetical protein